MDRFAELQAYVAVVETGSFSAAGERLGIAKSMVSRRVSQLESRLGTRLMQRTTRRLSLTDTGQTLYQRAIRILADLHEAEQSASDTTEELRGPLRLAAPVSFGILHLSGALTEFLATHPAIDVELDLNDRQVNLVEEGIDMAVRIAELEPSSLIARRLGSIRFCTCASPGYLAEHGEPQSPGELSNHRGLHYSNVPVRQLWDFITPDGKTLGGRPDFRIEANNGELLARAAVAGLGVVTGPTFILAPFVRDGALVPILTDYDHPATSLQAAYPPGRMIPRRLRVLTNSLAGRFGDRPAWDTPFARPGD